MNESIKFAIMPLLRCFGLYFVKQFIDFIPLILFFIVFKISPREIELLGYSFQFGGIFSATAVLVIASIVVYGILFIKQKRLDNNQWITVGGCLFFGCLTLLLQDEVFIKWKAPAVNWIFALVFLGSQFIGKEPVIKRLMGKAVTLPDNVWTKLNIAWVIFFIICGAANLFVAFTYESIWVDFKVFGSLIMTIIFIIAQGIYLSRYIKDDDKTQPKG